MVDISPENATRIISEAREENVNFQIACEFETGIGNSYGSATTVAFGTTFDRPPVVVYIPNGAAATDPRATVKNVTTTNFDVYDNNFGTGNWVAVTAGTHLLPDGTVIQAGYGTPDRGDGSTVNIHQYNETPAIFVGNYLTDDVVGTNVGYTVYGRAFGSSNTVVSLNDAGRSASVIFRNTTGAAIDREIPAYLIITQTGPVVLGSAPSIGGAQKLIGTLNYECGTILEVSESDVTPSYSGTFAAIPVFMATGESREFSLTPTTTFGYSSGGGVDSQTIRLRNTDFRQGVNWMGIDKGTSSVSNARRLR